MKFSQPTAHTIPWPVEWIYMRHYNEWPDVFITSRKPHTHTHSTSFCIYGLELSFATPDARLLGTMERLHDSCCHCIDDKPLVRLNRPYGKLILTGIGDEQAVNSCLPRMWHNFPSFTRYANTFPALKFTINMETHYKYTTVLKFSLSCHLESGTKWTDEYTNSVNRKLELVTK